MKITRDSIVGFFNSTRWTDSAMLFLRIFTGGMLMTHGIDKIQNYDYLASTFPSIMGMGSEISLIMAMLVEVGASALIICGLLTRLALIPAIFTMFMAAFFSGMGGFHELAFIYMGIFITIFIAGPGMYSIDRMLFVPAEKKRARQGA